MVQSDVQAGGRMYVPSHDKQNFQDGWVTTFCFLGGNTHPHARLAHPGGD